MTLTEIFGVGVSGLFSVIWFLLKLQASRLQKDLDELVEASKTYGTKAEVSKLFELHDQNEHGLTEVRLTLAGEHYKRGELDIKFEKLDATIKDGFRELSKDIKDMTLSINDTYKDHISTHHSKDKQ